MHCVGIGSSTLAGADRYHFLWRIYVAKWRHISHRRITSGRLFEKIFRKTKTRCRRIPPQRRIYLQRRFFKMLLEWNTICTGASGPNWHPVPAANSQYPNRTQWRVRKSEIQKCDLDEQKDFESRRSDMIDLKNTLIRKESFGGSRRLSIKQEEDLDFKEEVG